MHLPWPGGLSAHPTIHPWLLMVWVVYWSFFMVCSRYGARLCLIVGFFFFSPLFCSFLQSCISCFTILLFMLWCYLIQACWASLGLLLILLSITQYDHWSFYYMACRLLRPIYFLLDVLGPFTFLRHPLPFLILHLHRFLLTPFGFRRPNYFILHPWGSWAYYQPLIFFTCIASGLLWFILTLLHHILPMGLLFLSFWTPLGPFASSRPICLFYEPIIHYSCHLGLMVFLSTY